MEKYYKLAEYLSERFSPEAMCLILGKASKERIAQMINEYGIE